jgi:putative heme-binding domain-containing protein
MLRAKPFDQIVAKKMFEMIRRTNLASAVFGLPSLLGLAGACLMGGLPCLHSADESTPFGIDHRVLWTTSRVVGSPEPPLPYTVAKTFTNIQWKAPIFIAPEPGTDRLLVVQAGGEKDRPSRILRVRNDPSVSQTETFLVVSNRLIYSFTFHPGYRTNGHLFVFTHCATGEFARTNRISRYTVERGGGQSGVRPSAGAGTPESPSASDSSQGRLPLHPAAPGDGRTPPRCDPLSEQTIIEWHSEGHDGGGVVFGHDGMLYITSGDGTSDSDGWVSGQDVSRLLGGVLRLDVDHPDATRPYSVPGDNPFVGMTNARPEKWAYGLRNPWRLCLDQKTGQIWAGNNGQDLWETAHLIRRGENYGWSVYEGSHPFYLNRKLGPTPPVAPTIEHSHADFRSLTGGAVYYGELFPELNGFYVYGDYSTGEIWAARHDGRRVKAHRPLAHTQLQIAAFAVDQRGELLIADHGGHGLYRLVRSPRQGSAPKFPSRLSETGLFVSTRNHQVQPGLIPYSVNAPGWADGAFVERFLALPDDSRLGHFTNGAALMQTLSLEREAGQPASRQRIETRLLTFQNGQWAGYSYRWNDRQSDATLVRANGDERDFVIKDEPVAGGRRRQTWHFPSRAECMTCHSRAANFVLGLTDPQLNKVHDYGGVRDHQLRTLKHIGVFTGSLPKPSDATLVDPYDSGQDLDRRARSYLHVNCSVCHVEAGGGNAKMELGFTTKPERMNLFSARPQHDTFGIDNAMLVFPGDPQRSILYQRVSRRGRGQMPPLVTTTVDERAVALFREWIRGIKSEQTFVRDWKMEDLLPSLEQIKQGRTFESGRSAFRQTGCIQCHRFAGEGGSVGPDLSGVGRRLSARDLLESIVLPSKTIVEGYAATEIETKSGEVIAGRIEREDDRVVVMRPPTATDGTVTIRKGDIRQRALSKTSNMPGGMLNTLDQAQVFDLLAYLISDGESTQAVFRPSAAPNPEAK